MRTEYLKFPSGLDLVVVFIVFSGSSCGPVGFYEKGYVGAYEAKWVRTGGALVVTRDEMLQFDQELDKRVNQYIERHPELTERRKRELQDFAVHIGANKEQVQLLLGKPMEQISSPEKLPNEAKPYWKNTDEAWLYRVHSSKLNQAMNVLYFREDTLTHIIEYGYYYLLP